MRKIKGIKVPIHYYDIERKIKKKTTDFAFSENNYNEELLKTKISNIVSSFETFILYDNFKVEENAFFNNFFIDKKNRINYISCGLLTFGEKAEKYRENIDVKSFEKEIFDIVVCVYSKTLFETIKDMVNEEAKKERFSAQDVVYLYNPFSQNSSLDKHALEEIFKIMNISFIKFSENKIYPFYSWIFIIPWVPSKK